MNWTKSLALTALFFAPAQSHGHHHHGHHHDHRHLANESGTEGLTCGTIPSAENRAAMREAASIWKESQGCLAESDCVEGFVEEATAFMIPLKWHQIVEDDGSGGVSDTLIKATVDALNIQMAFSRIQFKFDPESDITVTLNSDWYTFESEEDNDDMKAAVRTDLRCDTLQIFQVNTIVDASISSYGFATFPDECKDNPADSGVVIIDSALGDSVEGVRACLRIQSCQVEMICFPALYLTFYMNLLNY